LSTKYRRSGDPGVRRKGVWVVRGLKNVALNLGKLKRVLVMKV